MGPSSKLKCRIASSIGLGNFFLSPVASCFFGRYGTLAQKNVKGRRGQAQKELLVLGIKDWGHHRYTVGLHENQGIVSRQVCHME
jgi:hypothetical protein